MGGRKEGFFNYSSSPTTHLLTPRQKRVTGFPSGVSPVMCQLEGAAAMTWAESSKAAWGEKHMAQPILCFNFCAKSAYHHLHLPSPNVLLFCFFLPIEGRHHCRQKAWVAQLRKRNSASDAPDPAAFKVPHRGLLLDVLIQL